MAIQQKFGIKYPFVNNKDLYFLDLNENDVEEVESELLHLLFTPKGQKLRDPEFGTNLVKYIFSPNDEITLNEIKKELGNSVSRYIANVQFNDIKIYDEENDYSKIISIDYTVIKGNKEIKNNVAIRL